MKKILLALFIIAIGRCGFAEGNCHTQWVSVSPDVNYLYFISDRDGDGFQI